MKKAQSLIEYTLILILISAVAVTSLHLLGKKAALNNSGIINDTDQNIIDTMSHYCRAKGLVYNMSTEQCEETKKN